MILSMTGYGKASTQFNDKQIEFEIKSLNGKSSDIRMRLPNSLKDKEIMIRKMIIDHGIRGKFDVTLKTGTEFGEEQFALNVPLVKKYFQELNALKNELGIESTDMLQSIMRIPNVVMASQDEINEEEWKVIETTAKEALGKLRDYRIEEGKVLQDDLLLRIKSIQDKLQKIQPLEDSRIVNLKERMQKNLDQFLQEDNVDKNRFEQEVLFYLEKLDITEEKIRLAQHCEYFIDTINDKKSEKGKKLSFISQEIGREINTLGAKAQQSDIQQLVVIMKDELEKIKEQLANII